MKKPRADAVLKTLPAERQAEIADYLRTHSLAETVEWLRQDGFQTGRTALSDFLSWYSLQSQFREDEQTTDSILEQLKAAQPDLTDEKLDELGQRTFSLLSIRRKDLKGFVTVRSAMTRAQLEKEKLKLREKAESRLAGQAKLARDKFEIEISTKMLSQALREQAERIANSNLSQADKIAAMRQAAFSDVDALQKSGRVKIPKT
jgi:hypothetical protein